jgi:hypothetical protein
MREDLTRRLVAMARQKLPISRQITHPGFRIVTRLTLEKASNNEGVEYGRMVFSSGRILTEHEQEQIYQFHLKWNEILKPSPVEVSDAEEAAAE